MVDVKSLLGQSGTIAALVAAFGVVLTALFAMISSIVGALINNSHQRMVAKIELDIKVMKLFNDFVNDAFGYGENLPLQKEVVERFLKEFESKEFCGEDTNNVLLLRDRLEKSVVTMRVPLARQRAAADAVANLTIKYKILLEPALSAMPLISLLIQNKEPYRRIIKHYGITVENL